MKSSESVKLPKEPETVEDALNLIQYLLQGHITDLILAHRLEDPLLSGVIIQPDPDDSYVEELPLGRGPHLIISLNLPARGPSLSKPGIHEIQIKE